MDVPTPGWIQWSWGVVSSMQPRAYSYLSVIVFYCSATTTIFPPFSPLDYFNKLCTSQPSTFRHLCQTPPQKQVVFHQSLKRFLENKNLKLIEYRSRLEPWKHQSSYSSRIHKSSEDLTPTFALNYYYYFFLVGSLFSFPLPFPQCFQAACVLAHLFPTLPWWEQQNNLLTVCVCICYTHYQSKV